LQDFCHHTVVEKNTSIYVHSDWCLAPSEQFASENKFIGGSKGGGSIWGFEPPFGFGPKKQKN